MERDKLADVIKQLEGGYCLPPLSTVALRLVEMASDEACTAKELAALIENDPSLAVRLLKLANSTLFRSSQRVTSLSQAVVNLGFQRLRMMALSVSIRDAFPMGKVGPLDYGRFWRDSLYRALIAKSLAYHRKSAHPDEAFIAGLILEIGLLILFDLFIKGLSEQPDELSLDSIEDLLSWERERYGVDHRRIGQAALRYWKFPEHIIASQEFPEEGAAQPDLAAICEQARVFATMWFQEKTDFHTLFQQAERNTGLEQDVLQDILLESFDQVEAIADSLQVAANREQNLLDIIEKANRALIRISQRLEADEPVEPRSRLPSFDTLHPEEEGVTYALQAVAHEIRNPLTAVGGFARKLAYTLEPDSREAKYAAVILQEAARLEKVLSNMIQ